MTMTTTAADRFTDAILVAWDSREPWEATDAKGLSQVDEDALLALCDESYEDYDSAEAEVLAFVRRKLVGTPPVGDPQRHKMLYARLRKSPAARRPFWLAEGGVDDLWQRVMERRGIAPPTRY